jgi:RHS repeat-associated protein
MIKGARGFVDTYDAFGALRTQAGASANPFRFTGEQHDSGAGRGLYYLRARHYDPALGRFVSKDPLPLVNRHAYVGNNPANYVDPYGLLPCPGCGIVKNAVDQTLAATDGTLQVAQAGLSNIGYLDVGLSGCLVVCATVGVQASFGEGFHGYAGGGLGTPQLNLTVNHAPGQHIATGWSCGASVYYGPSLYGVGYQTGYAAIGGKRVAFRYTRVEIRRGGGVYRPIASRLGDSTVRVRVLAERSCRGGHNHTQSYRRYGGRCGGGVSCRLPRPGVLAE